MTDAAKKPFTTPYCLPAATSSRRSGGYSRPSKHSLPAPHSRSLKNPSSNSSPYGNPSRTPSTPWRKMTAGFSTCLLSLGCLCVLLAALLECLKTTVARRRDKIIANLRDILVNDPVVKKRFDEG